MLLIFSVLWTDSSMKGIFLEHWVPGASAKINFKLDFFVKIPVCSARITQVAPPLHMKYKVIVVFYEQFILPKLINDVNKFDILNFC